MSTKKPTTEQFIEKARNVHGDKYSYDKVEYVNSRTKVTITCPEHGDFEQTPNTHLSGYKCPFCGRKGSTNKFIERAKSIHGDKYDYSKVKYINAHTKVTITCPKHGDFEQNADSHLRGVGCKSCYHESKEGKYKLSKEQFIQKAKEVHGDFYDYSKVEYKGAGENVTIVCPDHGEFKQLPNQHLSGRRCKRCSDAYNHNLRRDTKEEFIEKAKGIHGDFYDYSQVGYVNSITKVTITCPEHGNFEQLPMNHLKGFGCHRCTEKGTSIQENEIVEFIRSITNDEVINSDRIIISPYELDIVIPSKGIAIEYNGLYWHDERWKNKNYHLDKTNKAKEQGYQLIHIFEDEWINNKSLIKEKLSYILGMNMLSVYARQCTIQTPSKQEKKELYENNHIQGSIGTGIDIGLYYGSDLVACLSFVDKGDGVYDLVRYATAINVVGGFSKLLSYFKKNYDWNTIYTFADKRYSNGNLYLKSGFAHVYDTKPNYWYHKLQGRENRIKYQKHKLKNLLENFDPDLTEVENCNNHGLYRIFDCGHMKFELHKKEPL